MPRGTAGEVTAMRGAQMPASSWVSTLTAEGEQPVVDRLPGTASPSRSAGRDEDRGQEMRFM